MPTSTITNEGQIILPEEVREHLHLVEGDRVEFLIDCKGRVELRSAAAPIQLVRNEATTRQFHIEKNVEFRIDDTGQVELRPASVPVQSLFGVLHQPGMRAVSVEEMNEGIAQFHAAENERILKGEA